MRGQSLSLSEILQYSYPVCYRGKYMYVFNDQTCDWFLFSVEEKKKVVELVEAASEMESEVPAEVVEVIVDVAVQMGPEISHREMKLLQSVAKDTGADLSINDVKALTEIMETVGHDGITKDQVHVLRTSPNKLL